jgi:peptidoglycan/xylan/chitin deacetylase (PgdA/CDA1 family)
LKALYAKYLIRRTVSTANHMLQTFRPAGNGMRILMYHSIGSGVADDPDKVFTVSRKMFQRQMQHVKDRNVPLCGSIAHGMKDVKKGVGSIAVTFDDGYRDNLLEVAPVMEALAIPFTVFVVSETVRCRKKDYLTPGQLRELACRPGVTIASHGATHRPLATLSDAELHRELNGSRTFLEDTIGRPVRDISYPHGSVDRRVWQMARNAGYRTGCCSHEGVNDEGRHPMLLKRTAIQSFDRLRDFERKLEGSWDWYGRVRQDPLEAKKKTNEGDL